MKILLAIDDSEFSKAALRMLIAQNHPSKTTVRVLHVEVGPTKDATEKRLKAGRDLVARATEELQKAGFQADSSVQMGHVAPAIIEAAATWQAELIVIGSHGSKGAVHLPWGSVSEYVASQAPCSVQIIRIPRDKNTKGP